MHLFTWDNTILGVDICSCVVTSKYLRLCFSKNTTSNRLSNEQIVYELLYFVNIN